MSATSETPPSASAPDSAAASGPAALAPAGAVSEPASAPDSAAASGPAAFAPAGAVSEPASAAPPPPAVRPQRIRVVLAGKARARRPVRPREELEEQTRVGEVLVGGLIRAQLALALRLAATVIVGLGLLPLLFMVAPGVTKATVLGIRVPWLLLGALAYPFLITVGWVYVRMAERNERDFAELVERS